MLCHFLLYSTATQSYIHTYTPTHSFSLIIFHHGLSQEIGYSSWCWTVGPHCLSILKGIVCIYQPQTPHPSHSLPISPWQPQVCSPLEGLRLVRAHSPFIKAAKCLQKRHSPNRQNLQILHPNVTGISEIAFSGLVCCFPSLRPPHPVIIIFKSQRIYWFWNAPSLQKNSQEWIYPISCLGFHSPVPFPVAMSSFRLCFFFFPAFLVLFKSWSPPWVPVGLLLPWALLHRVAMFIPAHPRL